MKCDRCQKDVPVLTPSPDGDQDLCEECFSIVYHNKLQPHRSHKSALFGGLIAAVVVLGFLYWAFLYDAGGEPASSGKNEQTHAASQNPKETSQRTTRKTPVFHAKKNPHRRTRPAPTTPAATGEQPGGTGPSNTGETEQTPETTDPETGTPPEGTTETDPQNTGATTSEPENTEKPAESAPQETTPQVGVMETNTFSLACQSKRVVRTASVTLPGAEGAETFPIDSTNASLYELTCAFTPKEQNQVVLSNISITFEGEAFPVIQAKTQSTAYTTSTADFIELEQGAQLVFHFEADQAGPEVFEGRDGIQEIAFWHTQAPHQVKVTLLFALPVEFPAKGELVIGNNVIPVSL